MTKRMTAEELASDLICNIESDKELNTLWSEMHAGIVAILKDVLRDDRKATLEAAAERICKECGLSQDEDNEGCSGHGSCATCAAILRDEED
jgi:hypothetical protein